MFGTLLTCATCFGASSQSVMLAIETLETLFYNFYTDYNPIIASLNYTSGGLLKIKKLSVLQVALGDYTPY